MRASLHPLLIALVRQLPCSTAPPVMGQDYRGSLVWGHLKETNEVYLSSVQLHKPPEGSLSPTTKINLGLSLAKGVGFAWKIVSISGWYLWFTCYHCSWDSPFLRWFPTSRLATWTLLTFAMMDQLDPRLTSRRAREWHANALSLTHWIDLYRIDLDGFASDADWSVFLARSRQNVSIYQVLLSVSSWSWTFVSRITITEAHSQDCEALAFFPPWFLSSQAASISQ